MWPEVEQKGRLDQRTCFINKILRRNIFNSTISRQLSHQQVEQIKARLFNLRTEHRDSQVFVWWDQFIPKLYSVELIGLNWDLVDCTVQIKLKTKLETGSRSSCCFGVFWDLHWTNLNNEKKWKIPSIEMDTRSMTQSSTLTRDMLRQHKEAKYCLDSTFCDILKEPAVGTASGKTNYVFIPS